ncbi:hypothetical protein TRFO_22538 [Tritrichomonas foetus]|uniref:Uncharacterized protein n=1 Tax=Tritrichomonas foetus TaxID=1144522 RepID=A0A1J4KHQ2_9EUKA|nr:hypothetical protein TRFO_22538 [Tritrichomonas foetus]|eukprot:OHT08861.1 hypothetical protein TRFO_22538 [Tritrichomonas foetus]
MEKKTICLFPIPPIPLQSGYQKVNFTEIFFAQAHKPIVFKELEGDELYEAAQIKTFLKNETYEIPKRKPMKHTIPFAGIQPKTHLDGYEAEIETLEGHDTAEFTMNALTGEIGNKNYDPTVNLLFETQTQNSPTSESTEKVQTNPESQQSSEKIEKQLEIIVEKPKPVEKLAQAKPTGGKHSIAERIALFNKEVTQEAQEKQKHSDSEVKRIDNNKIALMSKLIGNNAGGKGAYFKQGHLQTYDNKVVIHQMGGARRCIAPGRRPPTMVVH